MDKRLSAVIAISLVCAGLFVFGLNAKSDTAVTFNLTSGTDNTVGAQRALSATEIAKLSASDNSRIQSDGSWPMAGLYDETKYLEFIFTPTIPASASVTSVGVTHEFYRSSAMAAAKLEIWDGLAWHDVALAVPHTSGTAGEISENKDITSLASTPALLNGIKIRFLAYRNDIVQSGLKTSHDLVQLSINYNVPPSLSPSDSVPPTDTLAPSNTSTPLATDASSSFVSPSPFETSTPTQTPIATGISTPTPTFTPFISFIPDPETTPDPGDPVASASMPLAASVSLGSPTPSPAVSLTPTPSPTTEALPPLDPTPNQLVASIVKPRIIHKKVVAVASTVPEPSVAPVTTSRLSKIKTKVVDIWHLFTRYLNVLRR